MTGYTPAKGLPYPDNYNDPADVPADIQALAEETDAAMVVQDETVSNAAPVGSVVMFAGPVAPDGWHLCNGTAHGSAALEAVLGSANTPDLRDRFIVGAGSGYQVGARGGESVVTLTELQTGLRNHGHSLVAAPAHTHGSGYEANFRGSEGPRNETPNEDFYEIGQTGSHLDRTIPAGGAHTHTVNASGGGIALQPHENRPPYYALTYIIRKG